MKHWFLDTNVLIDFLAERQPFVREAEMLFRLGYAQRVRLYVASLSFSNSFYLLRRSHGTEVARQMLIDLTYLGTMVRVRSHNLPLSPQVQKLYGSVTLPPDFDYKQALTDALSEKYGV